MKITNSKQIFLNDNSSLQNGVSPKSDEKFFDARFDELEGLHIEKSDTKEQHQDKNKIYTERKEDTYTITETKLKDDEPFECVVKRKNGTLKSTTKQLPDGNFETIVYREDGSVYSKGLYKDFYEIFLLEEKKYDRKGALTEKTYNDEQSQIINERYKNGKLYVVDKTDARRQGVLNERTVYNSDGSVYINTKYAPDGTITESIKNKRTDDPDFDEFDKEAFDGIVKNDFEQGMSGTCYFVSTVQSFLNTTKGREIIKQSVSYDKENDVSTVKFLGAQKEYKFSSSDIKEAMGRLSAGDPDFAALLLGYEKYRAQSKSKVVDSGFSTEVFKALCGKEGESNIIFGGIVKTIDNKVLDNMSKNLHTGNYAITVHTFAETVDTEFSEEDKKAGLINSHAYSLKNVTDSEVTVINPLTQKEITISREKFMESFITFAQVNLE